MTSVDTGSKCQWAKNGRLYISFLGEVLPFCMAAASKYQDPSVSIPALSSLSLHHHTLEEIVSSKFYSNELEESLKNTNTILPLCKKYCYPT